VRGSGGFGFERRNDNLLDGVVADLTGTAGTRFVGETFEPLLVKAPAPRPDRRRTRSDSIGDLGVVRPSAASKIIRERLASALAVLRRRIFASSATRSSSLSSMVGARFRGIPTPCPNSPQMERIF
jgi:hypothetical protein